MVKTVKRIKTFVKIIAIILISIISFIILFIWHISTFHTCKIKTEYGDVFEISCSNFDYSCTINLIDSNERHYSIDAPFFNSKKDLTSVCNTEYFRCYRFKNQKTDMYICALNPNGNYFWIDPNESEAPPFFKEKYSEEFKKVFLADKYIMEITFVYMYDIYHDEFITMTEKLKARDFEGLDKYGLTEEMVNDKDSLEEKIKIMEHYLNS